ncbi:MAG: DUF1134 domain-containing protein [Hyphomicrobium sp.]|jgi:hypothetical protein
MPRLSHVLFILALLLPLVSAAQADEVCTAESLAAAVDQAGAELRAFSAEAQPKLKQQLAALKEKKQWSDEGYEEKGLDLVRDDRITAFDEMAEELLTRIDTLGRPEAGAAVPCTSMNEVKASASELLAVMRTKASYINERINRELGVAPPPATEKVAKETAPAALAPAQPAPASAPPKQAAKIELPKPLALAPAQPAPWNTTTAEALPPEEPYPSPAPAEPLGPVEERGYTIEEIQEASRGFFGTVSTSLASVIEHAFRKSGRPTAYVLGNEGGGAMLAGVRYGNGTMYLRDGGTRQVYWHGPSIGYDIGAAGSRTLFLIYRLDDPERIYRTFTGIDGSAYLVGGVGITFLKGGDVLMAPIRSGLGLRLGASVGYVRFTPRPTWNPF